MRAKSQRNAEEASRIVDVIRAMRERLGSKNGPTIRAALAIARILDHRQAKVSCNDAIFMTTCQDVLLYNASRQAGVPFTKSDLESLVRSVVQTVVVRAAASNHPASVQKVQALPRQLQLLRKLSRASRASCLA